LKENVHASLHQLERILIVGINDVEPLSEEVILVFVFVGEPSFSEGLNYRAIPNRLFRGTRLREPLLIRQVMAPKVIAQICGSENQFPVRRQNLSELWPAELRDTSAHLFE